MEDSTSRVRFDSKDLAGNVNEFQTIEDITSLIEKRSGKNFKHKVLHADVVQMVGNIFSFSDFPKGWLSSEIIRATKYATRMKR